MDALFTLRPAREADRPYLNAYCYGEGMDNLPSLQDVTVAQNADGEPVGFIRLALGANGAWHVNPVVVHASWRGHGVGQALTEWALTEKGELRLVARGQAVPFYERLGFAPCSWEDVDTAVTEECDGCPLAAECHPKPMRKATERQTS